MNKEINDARTTVMMPKALKKTIGKHARAVSLDTSTYIRTVMAKAIAGKSIKNVPDKNALFNKAFNNMYNCNVSRIDTYHKLQKILSN